MAFLLFSIQKYSLLVLFFVYANSSPHYNHECAMHMYIISYYLLRLFITNEIKFVFIFSLSLSLFRVYCNEICFHNFFFISFLSDRLDLCYVIHVSCYFIFWVKFIDFDCDCKFESIVEIRCFSVLLCVFFFLFILLLWNWNEFKSKENAESFFLLSILIAFWNVVNFNVAFICSTSMSIPICYMCFFSLCQHLLNCNVCRFNWLVKMYSTL